MTFPTKKDLTAKNLLFYICIALAGLLALTIVMRLLPIAIFLFIFLAPPIFVLADAQERRMSKPVLWATFTLFTNVFGLVVYLLARTERPTLRYCPNCSGSVEENYANCPWCGNKLEKPITKCPCCETEIKKGWKFCPTCNAEIKEQPATDQTPNDLQPEVK
jgi:predicted amidophosphoribosyltransferase